MDDKEKLIEDEVMQLVGRLAVDSEQLLKILRRRFPTSTGGNSPIIITDGSLMITSIYDSITGPTGTGPYTYTVSRIGLKKLKRADGFPIRPQNAANPSWTLKFANATSDVVTIQQTNGADVTITVPASAGATSVLAPARGESVLPINFAATSATFDPGNGAVGVPWRHLSLHFVDND